MIKHGIKIDCSVTPHLSWETENGYLPGSKGSNYTDSHENAFFIHNDSLSENLLEVPVTIRKLKNRSVRSIKHPRAFINDIKSIFTGKFVWLRPNGSNLKEMLNLVEHIKNSADNYLMFVLHSSELMPEGSPSFKTEESIKRLYSDMKIVFDKISNDFTGTTLKDYSSLYRITQ